MQLPGTLPETQRQGATASLKSYRNPCFHVKSIFYMQSLGREGICSRGVQSPRGGPGKVSRGQALPGQYQVQRREEGSPKQVPCE